MERRNKPERVRPILSFNAQDETGKVSALVARAQELLDGEDRRRFMQTMDALKGDGETVRFNVYDDVLAVINRFVALEETSGTFKQYEPLDPGRTIDGTAAGE